MADQATYTSNVAVADPELARRKVAPSQKTSEASMTATELAEKEEVNGIIEARKRYQQDRRGKEREWVESFKMYMSWVDKTLNPFLSNLFIPKTREAVELLAAFLIGTNQSISATAENGSSDTMKARVAGKYLDFLWRKVIKARLKVLVWIKQAIVFGNGIMKFGWDGVEKKPWMMVCAIEDVYFDYFEADIQDSDLIIHEIRRDPDEVKHDEKYDLKDKEGKFIRDQVICGGDEFSNQSTALFNTFDGSFSRSENRGKVLVMEIWCKGEDGQPQKLKTLLPTALGWRVARRVDNPNRWRTNDGTPGEQFRPFSKLRFQTAALPNRAYDMSGVFPTVHIQKAFNDLFRQYFDSVVLINNPMWKKRRGARINPMELVRRPGGVITVGDVNKDLVADVVGDVKSSMIEMLNRLDGEFQRASMVASLVQQFSNTATGDSLQQAPLQTIRDMINENIVDALSEAGQMILNISLASAEGQQQLVLYENDKETATLDFDIKNIDGFHDVRVIPDRSDNTDKTAQNKALTAFIGLVRSDQATLTQYPSMIVKLYKRFLANDGVGDPDYFFEEEGAAPPAASDNAEGDTGQKVSVSMSYKDAPDDVRREIEAGAGFKPSTQASQVVPAIKSPIQPDAAGKIAPVVA